MPSVSDLTWEQLNAALGGNDAIQIVGDPPNQSISINASAICRSNPQSLTDAGVVEFVSRLFFAARDAQVELNAGLPAGEKVNAFLLPTQVVLSDASVLITQQLQIKVAVADNLQGVRAPNL